MNLRYQYGQNSNMKNAELKIIESTSHVVNEDPPKGLTKILSEFYSINL